MALVETTVRSGNGSFGRPMIVQAISGIRGSPPDCVPTVVSPAPAER
jgi:hypothetical protein